MKAILICVLALLALAAAGGNNYDRPYRDEPYRGEPYRGDSYRGGSCDRHGNNCEPPVTILPIPEECDCDRPINCRRSPGGCRIECECQPIVRFSPCLNSMRELFDQTSVLTKPNEQRLIEEFTRVLSEPGRQLGCARECEEGCSCERVRESELFCKLLSATVGTNLDEGSLDDAVFESWEKVRLYVETTICMVNELARRQASGMPCSSTYICEGGIMTAHGTCFDEHIGDSRELNRGGYDRCVCLSFEHYNECCGSTPGGRPRPPR